MLLVYINRGVFITPYEAENQGNEEINSVIEWVKELVTGESNDIDEDGDDHTDCSFTQMFLYDFPQQLPQVNLFSEEIKKNRFPNQENILLQDFCFQIDQPPEV
jgi:hypothetical protein